jgi:large subunit ribosomal protein L35
MPKMKTHSGAKKRFRLTAKGLIKKKNIKFATPHKNSAKQRRSIKGYGYVPETNVLQVQRLLALR